jgi:hypothetical protein
MATITIFNTPNNDAEANASNSYWKHELLVDCLSSGVDLQVRFSRLIYPTIYPAKLDLLTLHPEFTQKHDIGGTAAKLVDCTTNCTMKHCRVLYTVDPPYVSAILNQCSPSSTDNDVMVQRSRELRFIPNLRLYERDWSSNRSLSGVKGRSAV